MRPAGMVAVWSISGPSSCEECIPYFLPGHDKHSSAAAHVIYIGGPDHSTKGCYVMVVARIPPPAAGGGEANYNVRYVGSYANHTPAPTAAHPGYRDHRPARGRRRAPGRLPAQLSTRPTASRLPNAEVGSRGSASGSRLLHPGDGVRTRFLSDRTRSRPGTHPRAADPARGAPAPQIAGRPDAGDGTRR